VVQNVLNDVDQVTGKVYGPWRTMHVPVPDKLWLAPEAAERKGGSFLVNASNQIAGAAAHPLPFTPLQGLIAAGQLALRTYAIRSNDFKRNLHARCNSYDDPARVRTGPAAAIRLGGGSHRPTAPPSGRTVCRGRGRARRDIVGPCPRGDRAPCPRRDVAATDWRQRPVPYHWRRPAVRQWRCRRPLMDPVN
jgi:hypothetical protein